MNDTYNGDSVIDVDLEGYQPQEIVEDCTQPYTVRLANLTEKEVEWTDKKTGQPAKSKVVDFMFIVTDSGLDNPKPINYTIFLSNGTSTAAEKNAVKEKIIKLKAAFGAGPTIEDIKNGAIPKSGLDRDELVGSEAQAMLSIKRDEEYGDKNLIKRFIV